MNMQMSHTLPQPGFFPPREFNPPNTAGERAAIIGVVNGSGIIS